MQEVRANYSSTRIFNFKVLNKQPQSLRMICVYHVYCRFFFEAADRVERMIGMASVSSYG